MQCKLVFWKWVYWLPPNPFSYFFQIFDPILYLQTFPRLCTLYGWSALFLLCSNQGRLEIGSTLKFWANLRISNLSYLYYDPAEFWLNFPVRVLIWDLEMYFEESINIEFALCVPTFLTIGPVSLLAFTKPLTIPPLLSRAWGPEVSSSEVTSTATSVTLAPIFRRPSTVFWTFWKIKK